MAQADIAADIAYVATAGAAGLALAVSAWAARLHRGIKRREQQVEEHATHALIQSAACSGALNAFDDLRLALSPEGNVRAIYGPREPLFHLIDQPLQGVQQPSEEAVRAAADQLTARLKRLHPNRMIALLQEGEGFETVIESGDGAWAVEGRALGGGAWVRLSKVTHAIGMEAGPGVLAEQSPSPTWVVDGSGKLVWANSAWLNETRCESLQDARDNGISFDRGADALVSEAVRLNSRQEGFRWISSDGRRKAWKIIAEPLIGGRGAVIAFALDMTEAEETRDTLRRHVEAHDETLNHLADAVAIFGPAKRLAFHNTAFQQLFNIDAAWLDERPTHGELLDRLRQRRLLPEVVDYAQWKAAELEFYGASQASPDDTWRLPDGRTLRVVRQPHPLGGILLIFSDITDELNLRSRYNAQIQVQMATLDKLSDAVAVFGSDSRLRLRNDAFEAFWNLSKEKLDAAQDLDGVAQLCRPLLPDTGVWMGLKARVADPDPESRIPVHGEARTQDGRYVVWKTRPLPDGATLVAFSDETARRALEQALAEKEAALAESQALKREFVGSVSYELRTPLTTIVGYSELLEAMGDLPERSRQHAGAIRVAASHLARSIDDVLDMAQIDAGEMELVLGDVRLPELLDQLCQNIRPKVEGRGARLELSVPSDVPVLRADEHRVAQAVDHLLENACRAVSDGGVVELAVVSTDDEIQIRVSDTGRGIPFHLQAHVFDRFVRRERGGPGVALALVKALIELHGGSAEVESAPGKGATFILKLPTKVQSPAAIPELILG
ncbi:MULTISPECIES: sensor histidine kinase [unclassified Brevundimonas]|uniref:sensor histidine kinase n=1 Tax=unclassified Brevundimonas TaxID=2622653 RepID=UPI0025C0D7F1|nr:MULTISPECIES: PAS domain-containing sensor histidine kinase [unclassified Brevundimonas]